MTHRSLFRAVLLAAALFGLPALSQAQTTYTWANSNATAATNTIRDWFSGGPNTQGTWTGGTPVSSNLNTIQFFQDITTALVPPSNPTSHTSNINNGGAAFQLGTLTLSGRGSISASRPYTVIISGDPLNFSAATGTINLDAVNNTSSMTYNLNSALQLGTASSASALTITGSGNATFNIGGLISELQAGGGSLIKSGTSTVSLTNAGNSFTGGVSVTGGTLIVSSMANGGSASALGASSALAADLKLGNGTTLRYTGAATSTNRSFTIDGTADGHGATLNASGSAEINFTSTSSPAYGTNNQTRTLTLRGSFGGNTGNANTLAANIADNGTGAVSLVKADAGTWTLSGTSTFTGGVSLSGGQIRISSDANLGHASGQITFTGDATLKNTATINSTRQINLTGGTATFRPGTSGNNFTTTGKVTGTGGIIATTTNAGSGTNFTLGLDSPSNDFTGAVTIDAAAAGGGTTIKVRVGSLVDSSSPGSGNIRFGTTNTTAVQTLEFEYNGASALTLDNRRIEFFNSSGIASNSILRSSAPLTINTDLLVSGTGAKRLRLNAPTTITSTFNGILQNGSGTTVQIDKEGAGTWILSGANTYTGATSITGGTLIARNGSAFGTTGTANVTVATQTGMSYYAATDTALNIGGTLSITGGSATVIGGSIGSTTTSARINVAGNATTTAAGIKVNIYGNSFSGTTSGTGTYTLIQGGGTNTLNAATYTLGTVFNATNFTVGALSSTTGTVDVGITTATALTSAYWKGTATAGLTKVWAASNGSTDSNWSSTAGGAVQNLVPGSGADVFISADPTLGTAPTGTTLGADMTIKTLTIQDTANGLGLNADGYTLTITPVSPTVGITMNASVPASTIAANVALGASQTWTNNSANSLTVSGRVSGGNGLTTAGTGTIILSGANTYTGATNVDAGTLLVNGSLASGSAVAVNSTGTLGGTGTIRGAITVNSGGSIAPGNSIGTLTLAGNTDFNSGSIFEVELGVTPGSDLLNISGLTTTLNFDTGSILEVQNSSYPSTPFTYVVAQFGVGLGDNLKINGVTTVADGQTIGQNVGGTQMGTVLINTPNFAIGSDSFYLYRTGDQLILSNTPIPEPHHVLLICVGALLVGLAIRRRMRAAEAV